MGILESVVPALIGGFFGMEQGEQNRAQQMGLNQINREDAERFSLRQIGHDINMADRNLLAAREFADRNLLQSREFADRNEALQREFAQMGIRWKVEDAKAAGLHPLYALGGGAGFSPSAFIGGSAPTSQAGSVGAPSESRGSFSSALGDMGQNIMRAALAAMDPHEKLERTLKLKLLESQISETDARAQALRAQSAVETQQGVASAPIPTQVDGAGMPVQSVELRPYQQGVLHAYNLPAASDTVQFKPVEIQSRRSDQPGATAGTSAFWQEYNIGRTSRGTELNIQLPWSQEGPSETMENISLWQWPGIIRHNQRIYGTQWAYDALRYFYPDSEAALAISDFLGITDSRRADRYRHGYIK